MKEYNSAYLWSLAKTATSIGFMVALYGLSKCPQSNSESAAITTAGIVAGVLTVGFVNCSLENYHKRNYVKDVIVTLEKPNKSSTDWRYIKESTRNQIYNNMRNINVNKDIELHKEDNAQLHNMKEGKIVKWEMQNSAFVNEVLSGTYNNRNWKLEKQN